MAGLGMPAPPEPLFVPEELDYSLPRPAPGPRPSLALAGRISPWLAAAADTRARRLLTCDSSSVLRWYDLATLRLLGSCRLDRPAYQMLVSPRHGALLTASAKDGALTVSLTGDVEHAIGDLHSYDLAALYKQPAGQPARAARSLLLDGLVTALVLAPGGQRAYYLSESGREAHIGEVEVGTLQRSRRPHSLRPAGSSMLALAPDAPLLYAISAGRVVTFDPGAWKETAMVQLGGSISGLLAGRGGRLYLADRRGPLTVLVLDMALRQPVARWQTDLEGRAYLLAGPAPDRVLVGTSAVYTGCVLDLDVAGEKANRPSVATSAAGDRDRLLRGPLFLTPGGDYLLTGSGLAFRARKAG
jgi:hypothetical protein